MTIDFFLEHYDISEFRLEAIEVKQNKLYLQVSMPVYLELIANGYRPELSMDSKKTFIFSVEGEDKTYSKDSSIQILMDSIQINGNTYELMDAKVDVK